MNISFPLPNTIRDWPGWLTVAFHVDVEWAKFPPDTAWKAWKERF
jgi:hypothetical protein